MFCVKSSEHRIGSCSVANCQITNKHNLKNMPNKLCFVYLLYLNVVFAQICQKNDQNSSLCSEASKKYSEKYNTRFDTFLKEIQSAKSNYKPCLLQSCKCFEGQIQDDLKPFKDGITKQMIEGVRLKGTKYQVIERRLYRETNCMFPARCAGIEHFLLEIIKDLPDLELIINTRDWPQIYRKGLFGPVFSFSKTTEHYDIMYPAWAFWEGGPAISLYPKGIGRWDLLLNKLGKLANQTEWNSKVNKAFFRGSRTSPERDPLVLLSRDFPELVDAKYTKNQAWKSPEDTLNEAPAKEVTFEDHCVYKFLFNFRGVAASFRFKHVLLCKSLVFHVGDQWQEFFYSNLKPWIHYVPVKSGSSKKDLKNLIEFAVEFEDFSKEIAENGYNFVFNRLKLKDVSCYWKSLLKEYTKLLRFKPKLDENLVEIK